MFAELHRESIEGRVRDAGALEALLTLADVLAEVGATLPDDCAWHYANLEAELRAIVLRRSWHRALATGANKLAA